MASVVVLCLILAACSLGSLPGAFGTLYPIKPISSTSFSAGMPAQLKWVEDGKRPFLNATGDVKIDLYAGNSTYLATIAKGIDPTALSTTVFIPSMIPDNYHVYTLHFVTIEPPQTIYTADFGIIPNPAAAFIPPSASHSASVTTVTSTIYSRIVGTQMASPSATQKGSAGLGMSWGMRGRSGPEALFSMDAEKMKFRMVFIVWPTLVGLSMAL